MKIISVIVILLTITAGQVLNGQTYTPPGTIQLEGNSYIDKYEVSNEQYRLYIKWLKKYHGDNSRNYLMVQPDSDKTINIYFSPFDTIRDIRLELYLSYPQYNKHPVVSLSYEQVIQYCKWTEQMINDRIYILQNPEADRRNLPNNIPQIYKVRLPSKDE